MTGFDPTRFMGDTSPRVAEDGGGWASPPEPSKPAETRDVWADGAEPVASVAAVAELTGDKPFAADLNRLFRQPGCLRLEPRKWRRLLLAVHKFADRYAADALAAGWEPIELFGVHRDWLTHETMPPLACCTGIAIAAHGRDLVEITGKSIGVVRRGLSEGTFYRAHHMSNRVRSVLIWEARLT